MKIFYKNLFTFLLIIISSGALLSQSQGSFTWLHPKPQGQTIRSITTLDKYHWYAVTFGGAFMKTSNGGLTWEIMEKAGGINPETGDVNKLYDVYMLDENNGFICGENGVLCKTSNSGHDWHNIKPTGKIGSGLDIFFVNSKTGYVVGDVPYGIVATTDAGVTWADVKSPDVDAFSVFAFDDKEFFISSLQGGVFSTTNRGNIWSKSNVGTNDTLWKINFLDKQHGMVTGSSGIMMVTLDRGKTWQSFDTLLPNNGWYDIDFWDDGRLKGFSESFSQSSTPEFPSSWTTANIQGPVEWRISETSPYVQPGCIWINFEPTGGNDILQSKPFEVINNDTLSFYLRRSYTGTIFNYDSLEVRIASDDPQSSPTLPPAPVSLLRIGVCKMDTSESTYPPRTGTYKKYTIPLGKYAGNIVKIDFHHKNLDGTGLRLDEINVGDNRPLFVNRVYLTGNDKNLFRNTISPFVTTSQPWIPFDFSSPVPIPGGNKIFNYPTYTSELIGVDTVVVAGVGGLINIRYPQNKTGTFLDRLADDDINDIESLNSSLIAVGDKGSVLISNDAGVTWSHHEISPRDLNSISVINSETMWAAGSNGALYKTTSSGDQWINTKWSKNLTVNINKIDFVNNNTGWIFGDGGFIMKTTTAGEEWARQRSRLPEDTRILDAYMLNVNTGYLVGDYGVILKTSDGGTTWYKPGNLELDQRLNSIFMFNENTGWVCGENGTLLKTIDGGVNWTLSSLPYNSENYNVDFYNQLNGIISSENGKIYITQDGGNSWFFDNSGAGNQYAVKMTSKNNSFFAGSFGSIIKYTDETRAETDEVIVNNIPNTPNLHQNHPNPFNPTTTIKFDIPVQSTVSLKVYDITGREVANLINNKNLTSGSHSQIFDAGNLSSGIYFYSLMLNGKITSTLKMLLIK